MLLLTALLACQGQGIDSPLDELDDPATEEAFPFARSCSGVQLPVLEPTGFDNVESDLKAWQDPVHYVQDVLATDDGTLELYARFTYGLLEDPLRDEAVEIWVDVCQDEALLLGTFRTDQDGRLQLSLGADVVAAYGDLDLTMRVQGDGTRAAAVLRRFPVGTRLQVFDIDGTLTTSDTELFIDLFSEIGDGSYVPEARVDAQPLVELREEQGYEIVYLTGRPTGLRGITREWLDGQGFPSGTLYLTRRPEQILPFDDQVGAFKAAHVQQLLRAGFEVDHAYGNATTDIYAYGLAGLPVQRTVIMGEHGGEQGTVAGGEAYTDHLNLVTSDPPFEQPFRR